MRWKMLNNMRWKKFNNIRQKHNPVLGDMISKLAYAFIWRNVK